MARSQLAVSFDLLDDLDHLTEAVDVLKAVWGESAANLASAELLRAYTFYGNPVIGAFDGGRVCGVSIGFLAPKPELHLHSHITGVMPSHQRLGLGFGLKAAQRRWCVDRGIELVTWTFDPLLARNAHFNLHKLGAVSRRLLPDFYGPMDDDVNRGDQSDRLEVRWELSSARVAAAIDGVGPDGGSGIVRTVAIPADYHELRRGDPRAARAARARVREQLTTAFAEGLEIVGFRRDEGYCLASATG